MRILLRIILYLFIAVFIIIVAGGSFLLLTEKGLNLSFDLVTKIVPGKLTVKTIHGRLWDNVSVSSLKYVDKDFQFKMDSFKSNYQFWRFITHKSDILLDWKKLQISIDKSPIINNISGTAKIKAGIVIHYPYIKISQLQLNIPDKLIYISGVVDDKWDLYWKINIPRLAIFNKKYTGRVVSEGKIVGSLQNPSINSSTYINNSRIEGLEVVTAQIKTSGSFLQHKIVANININDIPHNIELIGNYKNKKWNGIINKLTIAPPEHKPWSLKKPANVFVSAKKIQLRALCLASNGASICADYNYPKLKGSLAIRFLDIAYFNYLLPEVKDLHGILNADISLTKSFTKPEIIANATLKNGRAYITPLNSSINNINITTSTTRRRTNVVGSAEVSSGLVTLDGFIDTKKFPLLVKLNLKGSNLLIVNNDQIRMFISPDLQLEYQHPNYKVSGTVRVPAARIVRPDFTSVTTLPANTKIIGAKIQPNKFDELKPTAQIRLVLGSNVYLFTNGLSAQLGGDVKINTAPKQITTALGKLRVVRGKYKAYGQELKIVRGELFFNGGSLDNPNLEIRATKKVAQTAALTRTSSDPTSFGTSSIQTIGTITVGVQVTGSISDPQIKLFSVPFGLTDTSILSYLMFGNSVIDISGDQAKSLYSTADKMGHKGSHIGKEVRQTFKTTEIDSKKVQETDQGIAGTLSPGLGINYGIGFLSSLNVINVDFQLTKYLTIQTSTTIRGAGIDLFYIYERD